MSKIIRTPTKAHGWITPEEREAMGAISEKWVKEAFRTDPVDVSEVGAAMRDLYSHAGLEAPRVVVVPSPYVMAKAYGAAAWIWYCRTQDAATRAATSAATDAATSAATDAATYRAIRDATDAATHAATYRATSAATHAATHAATDAATHAATSAATSAASVAATYAATHAATSAATRAATSAATDDATRAATRAATDDATDGYQLCAKLWWKVYQGGNMWASACSYMEAARDVLGLHLPNAEPYLRAARCGGFRVLHKEFVMVCDRPEVIKVDGNNLPHCEDGPSHRWPDGFEIYSWHGTRIPTEWGRNRNTIDPAEILKHENVEERAAGLAYIGWARALDHLPHEVVDKGANRDVGDLLRVWMPGLSEPALALMAECPRNGRIFEFVPNMGRSVIDGRTFNVDTAMAAQAARVHLHPDQYTHPEKRT